MAKTCDKTLRPEDVTVGMTVGERLNSLSIVMYRVIYLCIHVVQYNSKIIRN